MTASRVIAVAVALASCGRNPTPAVEDPPLPGIVAPSSHLAQRLANALARKGASYRPHTRHLAADGTPRFTNRLILETSPYLLQHAHNPVNWYAWGDEPFERARREGKLVMLSIGYSTCHWCHVMERESFEDEEVARTLNEGFICIKVDREERPDIDSVYLKAIEAMTGSGGWPMTVFVTAERLPFYGATYLPRDRLLAALQQLRTLEPSTIAANVARVRTGLAEDTTWMRAGMPHVAAIDHAVQELAKSFDATWGGFGDAPKFPQPVNLDLLLRVHRRTGDAVALHMVVVTLEQMAAGGIHDHLGGGFHRYATDARWRIPHFEKMLYDQAQLAAIYLDASQVTGRADFADIARTTLDYMLRDLQAPEGGFYSATDADSLAPSGHDEEGAYFTWTRAELDAAIGPFPGAEVASTYGVTSERSILHVEGAAMPDAARALLFAARNRRTPPHLDDKVVVAWNGLAISALARAAVVLDRPDYTVAAERAASRVLALRDREGRLARSVTSGVAGPRGVLADHAFVIAGLLDLFEADGDGRWLDEALALQRVLDRDFAAPDGGYFATPRDHEPELAREVPVIDGAEPSGNAIALANLTRLADLVGDDAWRARAETGLAAFSGLLARSGGAAPRMLGVLEALHDRSLEIALVAPTDRAELAPLLESVRRAYLPNHVLVRTVTGAPLTALVARLPWLEGKRAVGGRPTAFVCTHGACKLPTSDPVELARQLRDVQALTD